MALTHGSLFAGMGGLDLAITDVFGAETAWVSDVDPGANAILAHRYPAAPNLGDITRIDWATVEPVDIISGGSPCQDLSMAGRRAGMTPGTRSNLWESMREAIAILKPTFVVWENVHGALSATASSGLEHCPGCMGSPADGGPVLRALGRVLGDLADLGFDAQWHGLRAADVGACHGRFRVFVLAYANDARLQGQQDSQGAAPTQRHGHTVAGAGGPDLTLLPTPTSSDANGAGAHGTGGADLRTTVALLPTPRATDDTKGGPNQRGSSGDLMLPSAVVQLLPTPSVADSAGGHERRGGDRGGELLLKGIAKEVFGPLLPTPQAGDATAGGEDIEKRASRGYGERLIDTAHCDRWGDYAAAIARHEHAFGQPAPAPTEAKPAPRPTLNRHGNQRSDQTGQRLSASFVEWMMMLPAGWVTDVPGVTRNQALKALGNGVVPPQAAAALRLMLDRTTAVCTCGATTLCTDVDDRRLCRECRIKAGWTVEW